LLAKFGTFDKAHRYDLQQDTKVFTAVCDLVCGNACTLKSPNVPKFSYEKQEITEVVLLFFDFGARNRLYEVKAQNLCGDVSQKNLVIIA
jgi:hypothetical protein